MNKGMERQTILAKCIYCGHEVRFDVEIEINNHYRKEIEYYKKQLERMNKALTPPTSEEVCVALGEELNVIIVYKDKEFYYDWKFNGTSGISLIVGYYENVIKFYDHCLSPQSLSLVARFYKEATK